MSYGISPIEDIEQFLRQVRVELTSPGRFELIQRGPNMEFLADLGLTIQAAIGEIMSLTHHNYYKGPLPDDDRTRLGDVWVFVKCIDGIDVYIKLKLDANRGCVCLSFHELVYQVVLPY